MGPDRRSHRRLLLIGLTATTGGLALALSLGRAAGAILLALVAFATAAIALDPDTRLP